MKLDLKNFLYGFIIGISMLIPGISGGSVAVLLGIYEKLLSAVSGLFTNFRKNCVILLWFSFGGLIGFFVMAEFVRNLLENSYVPTIFFFLGVVIFGLILYGKKTFKNHGRISIAMTLTGIAVVIFLGIIPADLFNFEQMNIWLKMTLFVVLGIVLAIALVLPGISFSLMLVIIGLYDRFIIAVEQMDYRFLIPLGFSILFGIIVSAKGLHFCLQKRPLECHSIIFGFVIASVFRMFPSISVEDISNFPLYFALCAVGAVMPFMILQISKRMIERKRMN